VKLEKISNLLILLSKKGALELLNSLIDNPKRYSELKELFSSDKTLSERLKQFEEYNLIETTSLKSNGRFFVHYQITEKGKEVLAKVKEIK
jgi:DNA-binding HxlR family transcriptional regulator